MAPAPASATSMPSFADLFTEDSMNLWKAIDPDKTVPDHLNFSIQPKDEGERVDLARMRSIACMEAKLRTYPVNKTPKQAREVAVMEGMLKISREKLAHQQTLTPEQKRQYAVDERADIASALHSFQDDWILRRIEELELSLNPRNDVDTTRRYGPTFQPITGTIEERMEELKGLKARLEAHKAGMPPGWPQEEMNILGWGM